MSRQLTLSNTSDAVRTVLWAAKAIADRASAHQVMPIHILQVLLLDPALAGLCGSAVDVPGLRNAVANAISQRPEPREWHSSEYSRDTTTPVSGHWAPSF